jgi:hypothetical protein
MGCTEQMKIEPSRIMRAAFSASAVAFAVLLVVYIVVLFLYGLDKADKTWGWPWPMLAWIVALPMCLKVYVEKRLIGLSFSRQS